MPHETRNEPEKCLIVWSYEVHSLCGACVLEYYVDLSADTRMFTLALFMTQ